MLFQTKSIQTRIMILVLSVAVLIFTAVIATVSIKAKNTAVSNVQSLMQAQATQNAFQVKAEMEGAMDAARVMTQIFNGKDELAPGERRANYNTMLKSIIEDNPEFLGVWTCWEPNALDELDARYANQPNHDATGRFIPYWYRSGGKIQTEALRDYDKPGAGDYYLLARDTGKEIVVDPYTYEIDGKKILMTSVAVPVIINGKVAGVAGVDLELSNLQKQIAGVKAYQTGYGFLLSNGGIFAAHPKAELVGQSIQTLKGKINKIPETMDAVQNGKSFEITDVSPATGTVAYKYFKPITIGNSPKTWSFGLVVPEAEVMAPVKATVWEFVGIGLVSLLILIIVVWRIAVYIGEPVRSITEFMGILASGDLSGQVPEQYITRHDEFGILAKAVANLVDSFRSMIKKIEETSSQIKEYSRSLSESSQGISADMEAITASTQEIGAGLEGVSATTEELNASAEEVGAALNQLNDEAGQASLRAKEVLDRAASLGRAAIKSRSNADNLYNDLKDKTTHAIDEARVVEEISALAANIASIADQTNLLALNAAIEAARAGEQGRGFAVVADEVRKLAEDSSSAVAGIQELTHRVQESIRDLVNNTGSLLEFVSGVAIRDYAVMEETGKQYASDAGLFADMANKTSTMSDQILGAVTEINKAIESVATTMNQSSIGAQEIAKGADNTTQGIIRSNEMAMQLAETANELFELVGRFKM